MSIWQEREHEWEEREMVTDAASLMALCRCGLLKYARLELMRGQEELLRWLIQQWDERHHVFRIGGNELSIEKDDVYFLTGLSCRGPRPNLTRSRANPRSTTDLILEHCIHDTQAVSNQVPIAWLSLRPLSSIITQVFLEVVEKESIPEVTTNEPSDAESSQSASREGSLFIIYLCS